MLCVCLKFIFIHLTITTVHSVCGPDHVTILEVKEQANQQTETKPEVQ